MFDYILKKAQDYKVITFDVFDTLVIRDVIKPIDVFSLTKGVWFKYVRIAAEVLARKCSSKEEVTLKEIYKFLPFCDMNREIEEEFKTCRADKSMKEVYDTLKKQGKSIYAISDMYLPKSVIEKILENCGYSFDGVLVSSEYGKTKTTGKLYKQFLNEFNLKKEDVLHIGDNEIADFAGAKKAGVEAFLIPEKKNLLSYSKVNKKHMHVVGFVNNRLQYKIDRCEKLGYEVLGPIVVSFCQWLHKKRKEYNFEKLFFMSRDMRLVYDVYQKLYPEDNSQYIYISRKSLNSALDNAENLCKYLKKNGFEGEIALVDTGGRCAAQPILDYYAKLNDSTTNVGGLYMWVKTGYKYIDRYKKSEACFFSRGIDLIYSQTYSAFFENLIGPKEDKVIAYDCFGEPVFQKEDKDIGNISKLQKGAMDFANDWFELNKNALISPAEAFSSYVNLQNFPAKEDIDLLGDSEYDDVETTRIVNFNGCFSVWNIKKWFTDLRFSAWKGAYFKKSFKHPLLPYIAYLVLDSLLLACIDIKTFKNIKIEGLLKYY